MLTRGNPASLGLIASSLVDTASRFTAIMEATSNSNLAVGQAVHHPGHRSASLAFLLMDQRGRSDELLALIEFLLCRVGEAGALNLRAQLDENSPLFEALRRCGFSVYGVQTIWRLPAVKSSGAAPTLWREAQPSDEPGMRTLYQNLTPPVEQAAEPFQPNNDTRLVVGHQKDVALWAEYSDGPKGLYLAPVIPPATQDLAITLTDLTALVSLVNKPAYIQVRSHQSWMQTALEEIGAEPLGRFNLLVKHLTITQKVLAPNSLRSRVEQTQAKPTVPIIQNFSGDCATINREESG